MWEENIKMNLNKRRVTLCTGFMWLKIGPVASSGECGNEPSGAKMVRNVLTEKLLACKKTCSVELGVEESVVSFCRCLISLPPELTRSVLNIRIQFQCPICLCVLVMNITDVLSKTPLPLTTNKLFCSLILFYYLLCQISTARPSLNTIQIICVNISHTNGGSS
jgi:hypothetical protein